ncbi:hypothetical protein B0G69_7731 [Paraburkholderia sp. RAU2J]|nr:hypothetical protein B0G69_7731 [Paraburkholderia sp. RAU2J]
MLTANQRAAGIDPQLSPFWKLEAGMPLARPLVGFGVEPDDCIGIRVNAVERVEMERNAHGILRSLFGAS